MTETYSKPLPSLPESERITLGAVLVNDKLMAEAARLLTPGDFYHSGNARIFSAMLSLFDEGEDITPVSVMNELRKRDVVDFGGMTYITDLLHGMPNLASIGYHARQLKQMSERRSLIRLGNEISMRGMDSDETNAQLVDWADQSLATYRHETGKNRRGAKLIGELVDDQLQRFDRFFRNISDAVPTGFHEIDSRMTGGGLVRGFSHILAARPSMGKTALMLDIAENAAARDFVVYVATLEMMSPVLLDRLFAIRAGIPRWRVSPGMSNHDLAKLRDVSNDFRGLTLIIDDTSRGVSQMRRTMREFERKLKRPIDLMIADYLQLMRTEKGGTRNDQVGGNSRAWQELCIESNAAGLLLSQLSRKPEQEGREPELSDLRDSGEIEQDARAIFMLFGDKSEEAPGVVPPLYRDITFKCAKQGEGPLFRTPLPFHTQLATFRSHAQIFDRPVEQSFSEYES